MLPMATRSKCMMSSERLLSDEDQGLGNELLATLAEANQANNLTTAPAQAQAHLAVAPAQAVLVTAAAAVMLAATTAQALLHMLGQERGTQQQPTSVHSLEYYSMRA